MLPHRSTPNLSLAAARPRPPALPCMVGSRQSEGRAQLPKERVATPNPAAHHLPPPWTCERTPVFCWCRLRPASCAANERRQHQTMTHDMNKQFWSSASLLGCLEPRHPHPTIMSGTLYALLLQQSTIAVATLQHDAHMYNACSKLPAVHDSCRNPCDPSSPTPLWKPPLWFPSRAPPPYPVTLPCQPAPQPAQPTR